MEQQQQAQQEVTFGFHSLTGQEVEAIMNALNELPAKASRVVMNKLEGQIVQQLQAHQPTPPQAPDMGKEEKPDDDKVKDEKMS